MVFDRSLFFGSTLFPLTDVLERIGMGFRTVGRNQSILSYCDDIIHELETSLEFEGKLLGFNSKSCEGARGVKIVSANIGYWGGRIFWVLLGISRADLWVVQKFY